MATASSSIELPSPLTLRLPFWLAESFSLRRLLAKTRLDSWSETWPLVEAFGHSVPERRFVQRLLRQDRRWWVYRCHQRAFCGDFVIVDLSPPRGQIRQAAVVELKSSGSLTLGGGGAGNQFKNSAAAIDDVAQQLRRGAFRTELVTGDGEAVLRWLRGGPFHL